MLTKDGSRTNFGRKHWAITRVGLRFGKIMLICFLSVFAVSVVLWLMTSLKVSVPYMDEIFHVDQAQRYCDGRYFEWNEKITTPPGLYVFSMLLIKPLSFVGVQIHSDSVVCNTFSLRFCNCLLLTILFVVGRQTVFLNLKTLRQLPLLSSSKIETISTLTAINAILFPVLFLTNVLYYTDTLSTLSVLSMNLLYLRRQYFACALSGLASIFVRQTNVVWVAFYAALVAYDLVLQSLRTIFPKQSRDSSKDELLWIVENLVDLFRQRKAFLRLCLSVLSTLVPFLLIGLGFACFLVWNNGIVLGDRSAHKACIHAPQLLYFVTFTAGFGVFLWLRVRLLLAFLRWISSHLAFVAVGTVLMSAVIHLCTYEHPFLLADNRHYTFYIWKNTFRRFAWFRFAIIPVYWLCGFAVVTSMSSVSTFKKILFIGSTGLVTVPSALLEFRYFIIPYLICRLSIVNNVTCFRRLSLELCLYAVVNAVTFYLFLYRPFKWPDNEDLQRFMW